MKSKTHSTQLEKSKIDILHEYNVENSTLDKHAFSLFIKEKRKDYSDLYGQDLSTRDLANLVGIDYEMFRKILNQQKPTKKRDCIIAICIALCLYSGEINEALGLYQYMPALDEDNPRDAIIIESVNPLYDRKININETNRKLQRRGFLPLDIIDHRSTGNRCNDTNFNLNDFHYKVLKKRVRTPVDELTYADPYDSLCTVYSPNRYNCIGDMWLDDKENQQTIHLIVESNRYYSAQRLPGDVFPHSFKTLEESGVFEDYFKDLESTIRNEQQRLETILNDTKNYKKRIGAGILNDSIHVYMEQYNYTVPELNEYYLFEYIDEKYILSVFHESVFMQKYLRHEEYQTHYGISNHTAIETHQSLDDLEKLLSSPKLSPEKKELLRIRRNTFKRMQVYIDECLNDLKNRKIFVQNLENIYEDKNHVCVFYGLEKEFDCIFDYEYGDWITHVNNSTEFSLPDGTIVTITLEDLYRAFELGFIDIEEICRVKRKKGSIDALFTLD